MLPFNHMAASVMTAVRLARFDADAINAFDVSIRGFWYSFYAALLVAPFSLMMAMTRYGMISAEFGVEPALLRFSLIEFIAYAISWTAYPVLMASFVRFLDCERNYIRGIVSYNWAAVLQNAVYTPVAIVSMSSGGLGPLPVMVLIAVLFYGWFVAWKGFGISRPQAVMLVGLDLSIGVIISFWANRILLA
ncbi:MAG: hypothetical protein RIC16_05750 [Rhodospirillales bacterium]